MVKQLLTLVFVAVSASAQTPIKSNRLSVEALFLSNPADGQSSTLWLRLKNNSLDALIVCRPLWGYTWISPDPSVDAGGQSKASLHGCGDEDHDSLWLLLPGESRLDSFEVKGPAQPEATLTVDVEVVERTLDTKSPPLSERLLWKGRVADAIANGAKLRAGVLK